MFESVNRARQTNWKLRLVGLAAILAIAYGVISLWLMTQMPLKSYRGPLLPLSEAQTRLAAELTLHVTYLSQNIGARNVNRDGSLKLATDYVGGKLERWGYKVTEQTYLVAGQSVSNLETEIPGSQKNEGMIVIGAHYDTAAGTVGANDNASGVAAVLELARILKDKKFRRSIRFVFFANEEPPFFQTEQMGSLFYARKLHRDGARVCAMISLETIGFYSDAPGSQKYPLILGSFYPNRGNFVGFVGNSESRDLLRTSIRIFRESARFPSEGIAASATWPGVGWSDHWSFWQEGYPAIMITDTAIFRYPHYHTALDTSENLDFGKMARVVEGTASVISELANGR